MKEYEYSFKVKNVNPYIEYCKNNGFKEAFKSNQIRDWYKNNSSINARITVNKINGKDEIIVDFKAEDKSDKILKNTKESLPLKVDNNIDAIDSILDILGYKLDVHVARTRSVYKKGNVKFEIDEYTEPEIMNVVAIEGEKEIVDSIYESIKNNVLK